MSDIYDSSDSPNDYYAQAIDSYQKANKKLHRKDEMLKAIQQMEILKERQQREYGGAEVTAAHKNPNGSISMTVTVMERMFQDERMFREALQEAVRETVRAIANVIINERKADIEAACNFEDLRADLAAELARQFMAIRFSGQPANTKMSDAAKVVTTQSPISSAGGAIGYNAGSGVLPQPWVKP